MELQQTVQRNEQGDIYSAMLETLPPAVAAKFSRDVWTEIRGPLVAKEVDAEADRALQGLTFVALGMHPNAIPNMVSQG